MSGVTVAAQLDEARATLADLEADLPTLEGGLESQNAELERVRREARAGRVDFEAVVAQQTRRDAAHGILQQHLEELASTRALIEELQNATAEAQDVAALRQQWEVIEGNGHEYAALSQELEQQLRAGLDQLAELRTAHQAAQQEVRRLIHQAAVRATGLTAQQVADQLRSESRIEPGTAAARVQQAALAFAEVADPDNGAELVAVARSVAQAGSYGPGSYQLNLQPTDCPLVSQAQQAHRRAL